MSKKGVLLINLGTPDNSRPLSVRRYLREFLNDPRVIDLPVFLRWPLVNLIVVPLRYKKTALAYQKIWYDTGSPLLVISQQLKTSLSNELGPDYHIELGMRYGQPSIQAAFDKLKNYSSLTVIPLFPQYSSAATGSAIEALLTVLLKQWNIPKLAIQRDFYQHPGFVAAYADIIKQHIGSKNIELFLFSYHGLPERHIRKSQCQTPCDRASDCPAITDDNRFCYRAQCYATSHYIADQLGLNSEQYAVSFQSRLGRTPWIKPYTDLLLPELIKKGTKNLAIVCPSFVADCLETLEEINIRAHKQWFALGGTSFTFIPCINHSPLWIKALADMVRNR
jgi:ferrochelatase